MESPLNSFRIEKLTTLNSQWLMEVYFSLTNNSFYFLMGMFLLGILLIQHNQMLGNCSTNSNLELVGYTTLNTWEHCPRHVPGRRLLSSIITRHIVCAPNLIKVSSRKMNTNPSSDYDHDNSDQQRPIIFMIGHIIIFVTNGASFYALYITNTLNWVLTHTPYGTLLGNLYLSILFMVSLDSFIKIFVWVPYPQCINPNWVGVEIPFIDKTHYWLIDLKLLFIGGSLSAIYYRWNGFYWFISHYFVFSLILGLLLLFLFILVNSTFVNLLIYKKYCHYIDQTKPLIILKLINHRWYKFYNVLGWISSFIAVFVTGLIGLYNVSYLHDNQFIENCSILSVCWLSTRLLLVVTEFIYFWYIGLDLNPKPNNDSK